MKIQDLINLETMTYNWDEIDKIPLFQSLKECKQNPKWHGEGDAYAHTRLVCQEAQNLVNSSERYKFRYKKRILLLMSALFHDIGKTTTTKIGKDNNWHSYGHELESERIIREVLEINKNSLLDEICQLVRHHMEPLEIFKSKTFYEKLIDLSNSVPSLELLIDLKMCDVLGSHQENEDSKKSDLTKLESLIKISKHMSCYEYGFPDYKNEYKNGE